MTVFASIFVLRHLPIILFTSIGEIPVPGRLKSKSFLLIFSFLRSVLKLYFFLLLFEYLTPTSEVFSYDLMIFQFSNFFYH